MAAKKTTTKKNTTKKATSRKQAPSKQALSKPAAGGKTTVKRAPQKMSALDAAAKVLSELKQPLRCREMIEQMAAKGYWKSPGGKTPVGNDDVNHQIASSCDIRNWYCGIRMRQN